MKLVRAKHFLVTVTAILSLFVSAVSACACSHHQPLEVETSSCHNSSHEAPADEQPNGSDQIDTGCGCFARSPVPAIVAKKDEKRTGVQNEVAEVTELPYSIAIEFEAAGASAILFASPSSDYQHALLASLPARAPPRL